MNLDLTWNRETLPDETFPEPETPESANHCAHCGGDLHAGFLVEPREGYEPAAPTLWQRGVLPVPHWGGVELKAAHQHKVVVQRCDRCGRLEFFAP